jgi:hypothetical protein
MAMAYTDRDTVDMDDYMTHHMAMEPMATTIMVMVSAVVMVRASITGFHLELMFQDMEEIDEDSEPMVMESDKILEAMV